MSCKEYPSPDMGCVGQVINLYVSGVPLSLAERAAHDELLVALPPPMHHGLRVRVWDDNYPSTPYPGLTVGMRDVTVVASDEVLVPYTSFNMDNVPWEKL